MYRWGCARDKDASATYNDIMVNKYDNFTITEAGLFVDSTHLFFGATPDGIT